MASVIRLNMLGIMNILHLTRHFHAVNFIGLNVGSECVTFESISSHPDTSAHTHEIGWIKILSCTENPRSLTVNTFTIYIVGIINS